MRWASFQVAVVLNLTPDHLDRHGTMRNYAMTKCRIFSHMTDAKLAILPLGMHLTRMHYFPYEHFFSPSSLSPTCENDMNVEL